MTDQKEARMRFFFVLYLFTQAQHVYNISAVIFKMITRKSDGTPPPFQGKGRETEADK